MRQADRTIELLQNLSHTAKNTSFLDLLAPGRLAIVVGAEDAEEPQGQLVTSFAANLAVRLFPVVQDLTVVLERDAPMVVRLGRWQAPTLGKHLHQMLTSIGHLATWRIGREEPTSDCQLRVGSLPGGGASSVFVGSNGWNAYVSPTGPMEVGGAANPVGAFAAACFGVAEIWKRLLEPHRNLFKGIPILPEREPLHFSTLTYEESDTSENPPLPQVVDLGCLTVTGTGAGGGATVFTLAAAGELVGSLNLVDPDLIDQPNLNRYVWAELEDAIAEKAKVSVLRGVLGQHPRLQVAQFEAPFAEALNTLETEDLRRVVAMVHSREARRQIQMETPAVLWDAGASQEGDFAIWRMRLGRTECMFCKHPPCADDPDREKAAQLATLLGLDQSILLRKLCDNEVFSRKEVAAVRRHLEGEDLGFDPPVEGERFSDWEQAQCGRIQLKEFDEEVPIPFAPVMAGVLIAGEIIKEISFPKYALDSRYSNTLVGRFGRRWLPARRPPRPGCRLCSDPEYLAQHARRWGVSRQPSMDISGP